MTAPISMRRGLLTDSGQGPVDGDRILCTLTSGKLGTLWLRIAEGKRRNG